MGVVLVLLCAIASAGCQLLFNLDHIDRRDANVDTIDDGQTDGPPGAARRVFATSVLVTGNMGGLAGADEICQQRASIGSLPGTYLAWLSTAAESPASRLAPGGGPYRLPNDAIVADNWADLTDGMLRTAINVDEAGSVVAGVFVCTTGQVWSNTDARGNRLGNDSCNDWTSNSAFAAAALVASTDSTWTEPVCPSVTCSTALPLYCFER